MEYDLDALFPKGVVDDSVRREVLRELLRNTRRNLTRQLRQFVFFTMFVTVLTVFCVWSVTVNDGNPWFWIPMSALQGTLLVLWACIWTMILRERDKVDEALNTVSVEESDAGL